MNHTFTPASFRLDRRLAVKLTLPLAVLAIFLLAPAPPGLTEQGQRALAVMALAVVLWGTELLPVAVTGVVGVVLLVVLGAVPSLDQALHGFAQPVTYFLIGILTLGLAVHRSGLAERLAILLIRTAGGKPAALYFQMLFSFAALTFALPSASTRGAIMVHIYEQVMARWGVPKEAPFYRAVMLAMGSLNRLGSTALLAGGITPVVASGLLGDFSWTKWFVLMSVPFYANLVIGGTLLYFYYRAGFRLTNTLDVSGMMSGPVKAAEVRAAIITVGTALLWFTDFLHGLPPAVPALIALGVILMPGVGVLSWKEFEQDLGWSNFFVIATSLSLAHALVSSGAAAWFSTALADGIEGMGAAPLTALFALCLAAALIRLLIPNIAGFLALVIPIAMSTGQALGLDPLVCGMAVVVVGDSVIYYPAQATASVLIYYRAGLPAPLVFGFGLAMTVVAIGVLFGLVLPYWGWIGLPLTP
ncbi:MAG: hypothetical protein FJ316_05950 [SAR202 cluster bacterium]|nr:hypothetical protein [SAR202 cluster bacterium]